MNSRTNTQARVGHPPKPGYTQVSEDWHLYKFEDGPLFFGYTMLEVLEKASRYEMYLEMREFADICQQEALKLNADRRGDHVERRSHRQLAHDFY